MRFSGFDDEWKKSNLGNISSNEMYGMNSAAKDYDGFNKYIRITDISETSNKFIPNPLTSPDGDLEDKYKLKKGDIVFARTGASTGKTYLYDDNDRNLYFAGFLIKFHIDNADPKFIFYNTLKEEYLNWVSVMSVRSGQPGINSNEYKKLPIILPSLDEQNKISNFLTSIDKKIDLLERKHQFYQEFKKFLMQQIFTQKLRFDFSDEWKIVKLESLIKKGKAGGTPSSTNSDYYNGDIPFLSIRDMTDQGKYIVKTEKTITEEGLNNSSAWIIPKNSLLYSIYASIGLVAINRSDISTSQAIYGIILKDGVSLEYMYYYLTYFKKNIHKYIETGTQGNLNAKLLKSFEILLPSLGEQEMIVNVLFIVDEKIENSKKEIEKINEFKKGLLQQMFVVRINWRCNFKLAKSPSFNKHLLILKNKIIFIIIK